jgi:hypothetical protein
MEYTVSEEAERKVVGLARKGGDAEGEVYVV